MYSYVIGQDTDDIVKKLNTSVPKFRDFTFVNSPVSTKSSKSLIAKSAFVLVIFHEDYQYDRVFMEEINTAIKSKLPIYVIFKSKYNIFNFDCEYTSLTSQDYDSIKDKDGYINRIVTQLMLEYDV